MKRFILILAVVLMAVVAAQAQSNCRRCDGSGVIVCPECNGKADLCPTCKGLGPVPSATAPSIIITQVVGPAREQVVSSTVINATARAMRNALRLRSIVSMATRCVLVVTD